MKKEVREKRLERLVKEVKEMGKERWKEVKEIGVEYIEERENYGDKVDIGEYKGIVDFIRYMVYGYE